MSIEKHLSDIDFRSRQVRQLEYKQEFINWYEQLYNKLSIKYDTRLAAQIEMLSVVLWHLLDEKEYKKLRHR